MKRRDFLRKSSLIVAGAACAGMGGLRPRPAWAGITTPNDFCLDIVTDQPGYAIPRIEQMIRHSALRHRTITFEEYQLPGRHMGDIAFVRSHRLIDFRNAPDAFSRQLTDLAKALSLPRRTDTPMLLRFYTEDEAAVPHYVNILRGNVLLERLPLAEARAAHRIEGAKASVTLVIKDRSVRIVAATCKHKTCMKLGAISRPGQSLVCIPAQISVALEGRDGFGVDSITF